MAHLQTSRALYVVAVGSAVYFAATAISIQIAMSIAKPDWWFPSARLFALFSWLQMSNWIGVAIASAPFALAIWRCRLEPAVPIAFCLAFLGLALPNFGLAFIRLLDSSWHSQLSASLDLLKFSGTLPLMVWLLQRCGLRGNRRHGVPAVETIDSRNNSADARNGSFRSSQPVT
jgi:hypothetical protein